jgi:hypothetical protein
MRKKEAKTIHELSRKYIANNPDRMKSQVTWIGVIAVFFNELAIIVAIGLP